MAVDSAQLRVPEKSALLAMKSSALIVVPAPFPFLMSFKKMHPGAGVEMPPSIRTHGVPSVGLLPVAVKMVKIGEVMGTEPVPPPVLITGSPGGIESASATAVENTKNAANANIRTDFISLPMGSSRSRPLRYQSQILRNLISRVRNVEGRSRVRQLLCGPAS